MPQNTSRRRGAPGRHYRVVMHYREPTYEARNGRRELPYRVSREVIAVDHGAAEDKAKKELLRELSLSGVSWIIEFERVMVTEALATA